MLPTNRIQEDLGNAYLRAVCARPGCTVQTPTDFGVDLCVGFLTSLDGERRDLGHLLGIQAKTTTRAVLRETEVVYDLALKNYRDLVVRTGYPRVLVVLVLPDDERAWLEQSEDQLVLRHCAYWEFLRGRDASQNVRSVRVAIPRARRFDVAALHGPLRHLATTRRLP